MTMKNSKVIFKSIEEYRKFYYSDVKNQKSIKNKYYRIGENVAKMACNKVVNMKAQSDEKRN